MVIDTNAGGVGKNRLNVSTHASGKGISPSQDAHNSTAPGRNITPSDSVSLSGAAKAMSQLENNIAQAPDIDRSKVDAIKHAINSGDYQPNPHHIADKMLSDF
ncbi:flagellar biosynthesis anti-sigma factor FlgM [Marinagarivorans algicola]|uniref:flagellar biosynthesis anti-sigma factor FlgM n=1 Tax=Marinagarivorans algicola TaxID=1513270 RepID=UPI0006B467F2|nr:flagellar biosynthesis anti-sigma factor FlgM [Marinagarivorans algicola]